MSQSKLRHFSVANLLAEPGFRWRGAEMTRVEAFTDAVFAFAVTLLVVSLEVPKSFTELTHLMRNFLAFAACFALLVQVWYNHVKFMRRFGLQDAYVTFLNGALLFVVLFFVYPLKFLFYMMLGYHDEGAAPMLTAQQAPQLMIIYGLGFATVYAIFALMYLHAQRFAAQLELNEEELFLTRVSLIDNVAMMGFGLVSATIAVLVPPRVAGLAGFVYMLIGAYFPVSRSISGKKLRKIQARKSAQAAGL